TSSGSGPMRMSSSGRWVSMRPWVLSGRRELREGCESPSGIETSPVRKPPVRGFASRASRSCELVLRLGLALERRQFGAQRGDLGLQRVELVAAHEVELGDHPVGLSAERRLGLLAGGLGHAHGGRGQLGHLVEEGVLGLHLVTLTEAEASRMFLYGTEG